jgi:hypothetical protein
MFIWYMYVYIYTDLNNMDTNKSDILPSEGVCEMYIYLHIYTYIYISI